MATTNQEIRFIKPCRMHNEGHRELTPEYARQVASHGRVVQINLDNCSIQRMEQLPMNPTLDDVANVGLLPLANILQRAPVALSAIGLNEMPDRWVASARAAYERFCTKFWPGHIDDVEATHRGYDETSSARKIDFKNLSDGARCVYGAAYVALLQIQNIRRTYSSLTPERQHEVYLYSLIAMLDMVSAFELEIAKHAFWGIEANAINELPNNVQSRLRDIKENFSQLRPSLQKCREFALNGAIDIHWLSGANLAEDFGHTLNAGSVGLLVDNWVGTNDVKLYRISKDIHSVYHNGSTMKRLMTTRESELQDSSYWTNVDRISTDVLLYRKRVGYMPIDDMLQKIDSAVIQIERNLEDFFSRSTID